MADIPVGTDPVLDEGNIVALLKSPVTARGLPELQAGAAQALIDMYDRDGTRKEFVMHGSNCLALYSSVGRLNILHSILDMINREEFNREKVIKAIEDLTAITRAQSELVCNTMERIQLQATSQDIVH